MLFYNFYSKLKEAIGNNSLEELPPKKIKEPAIKIFMLMTLSNLDDKPPEDDSYLRRVLTKLKEWLESNSYSEASKQLDDFINEIRPLNDLSEDLKKILEDISPAIKLKFNLLQKHFNDSNSIPNRFVQFKVYLKHTCFWRSQKDDKFRKYRCGDNGITSFAKIIYPYYLVKFPHFKKVINNLKDDDKKKLYEQFKYDLTTVHFGNSLDFLGTDLANLLKKIIKEAAKDGSEELEKLEKLWKKEKEHFLEMVFYPMLYYFISYDYERNFNYPYPIVLKILNENKGTIIEKHSNSFLLNLFFFISKKEQIFKYIKVTDIALNDIRVFSPIRIYGDGKTSDSDSFDLSYYDEQSAKEFLSRNCEMPNDQEPLFKDIKQILKFKNFNDNDKSSHAIMHPGISSSSIGKDSYLGIKQNLFNNYYEDVNNKDKIDNAYKKTEDFWERKKNTELFKLIRKKLNSEAEQNIRARPDDSSVEEREFVDKNFKKLINYYLHGAIPQREYTPDYGYDRSID